MKGGDGINNYIAYHVHSEDSLLDSVTSFDLYISKAKELNQPAIASTEHGKPLQWVEKLLKCKAAGIKFIHGVEIYLTETHEEKVRDNYHTVLLARNMDGVRELNRLVSLSCERDHFYYVNRISFDEFLELSDNIITTSACLASPLNKLPRNHPRYMELAQKYDFLEIQPHNHPEQIEYNGWLYKLSQQLGKPLIAGTDTHSLDKYKAECRSILLAAKHKSYGDEDSFDLTYKTYDELVESFRYQNAIPNPAYLQAIDNTNLLNDWCEELELDTSIKYPILYGSREEDEKRFEESCWESLDAKLEAGIIPPEQEQGFRDSITEELRVFKKLHMGGFMLSMSELIRWCKSQGMAIGTARGSVGGSRCAYVTDIIDLNPEQWHTVFSRFANENRIEPGDIDTDVVESDRPAIFKYITERFGRDKTARVASYGTLADRSVIEEVGRGLRDKNPERYSVANIDRIKKEYVENPELAKEKYPDIFYYYDGLVGCKISQSVHPAGMVISPITLNDNYGVFDKDGEVCLMMDMDCAHMVGAIKYDLLVLKTVQLIRDTCNYLGERYPQTYQINWDDQEVWEDMHKSLSMIFQFESSFASDCFKKFKPRSIFDMSLVTACIRPTGASYRDDLLARKPHHNPSAIIDEVLQDSNGYLVYQESVIAFLQQACGFSGSASDDIRRLIAKKQRDRLDEVVPKIIDGYCQKSDKPREIAEQEAKEFLQVIEDSASYMFNYAHSVAYCLLGYLCGYYRHYHPLEFLTSFLNNAANDEDISNGTAYANRIGIKITMPKWGVSKKDYFFDKEKNVIAKGLASVKYLSASIADELYELAHGSEYETFTDLLFDLTNQTSLDSRQLDILIKIDFFSQFGNQRELFRIVEFFNKFKQGAAKQIDRTEIDGTEIEPIIRRYATDKTKTGAEAKRYTLMDVKAILNEIETLILDKGMPDIDDITKVRNFNDVMGYIGYVSNKPEDRRKLFITKLLPLKRKKDGKQFGYSFFTKSIGSGVEARFTVMNSAFNKHPVKAGDIIYCIDFSRDGPYFRLNEYRRCT